MDQGVTDRLTTTSAYLVGKDLVESVAVVLEGHSAVWLDVFHFNILVEIYHKLALRMDLQPHTNMATILSVSLSPNSHLHKDLLLVHGFDDLPNMRALFL